MIRNLQARGPSARAVALCTLPCALLLSSCAMPGTVQRLGVEYNTAVAGMANELTLLNIARAKEDLPLHYTSVSRLTGSLVVKASSSVNGQLKESGNTGETSLTSAVAPGGTTVTDVIKSTIVKGGNVYTPSLGGEITTGPSFDIAILDTQKFYQGILAAVPFPTVENYINQGFDNQLVLRLMVERIEYVLKTDGPAGKKGDVVRVLRNAPSGDQAKLFSQEVACYQLLGMSGRKPPKALAPLSRLTRDATGAPRPLEMGEVALLDGKTFDLTGEVKSDGSTDSTVTIDRLSEDKRIAKLKLLDTCGAVHTVADARLVTPLKGVKPEKLPEYPPEEPIYAGSYKVLVPDPADPAKDLQAEVDVQVFFRSPEGLIRFLGQYLDAAEKTPGSVYRLNGRPLFSVTTDDTSDAVVSTRLMGKRYAIANDEDRRRNMVVVALIEQLVNLHKESGDRPVTQPVQVVQ